MNAFRLSLTLLGLCTTLGMSCAAAEGLKCSIRLEREIAESELPARARVSEAIARQQAQSALSSQSPTITSSTLSIVEGCVVYRIEADTQKPASHVTLLLDAGNGSVLRKESAAAAH